MADTVKLQTDPDVIQLVQDAKDAARYRWLRNRMDVTFNRATPSHVSMDDLLYEGVMVCTNDFIDEAIDAAMAKESGR